jgi:peroxiredoxin
MNQSFRLSILRCAAGLVLFAVTSKAADGPATPPKEIAVGDLAPAFTLKDQNDQEFSLAEMLKHGPVAVVFIRSIDWCSYCQLQTVQLSEHFADIKATGGQVVLVCYDAPEKVKRFAQRRKLAVPILADTDSRTIDAYAMRALRVAGDQSGSAQHGTFVIDKSGIVRSKPYLTTYEGDSTVEMLVNALKAAGKEKS